MVYEQEPVMLKPCKRVTGSNLVDMGRDAAHGRPVWMADSVAGSSCRWGGHGEGLRRSRGDAAGAELDAKLIKRLSVNTGTSSDHSCALESIQVGGMGTSSAEDR
jgi:hypothetical protein